MAAIILNATEKALVEALGTDAETATKDGLESPATTPYCERIVPVPNYAAAIPPHSEAELQARDGFRAGVATLVRRIGPLAAEFHDDNPSVSIAGTAVTVAALTLAEELGVTRKAVLNATFSASSSAVTTGLQFWPEVNGIAHAAKARYYFNATSDHRSIAGSWVVDLPAGAVSIVLKGQRSSGAGTVTLDGNDSVALTLLA